MQSKFLKYFILVIGIASISLLVVILTLAFIVRRAPVQVAVSSLRGFPTSSSVVVPISAPAVAPISVPVKTPISTSSVFSSTSTVPVKPVIKEKATTSILIMAVPFTSQAPLGEWSDQRQQDGCEEASAAMVMAWVNNEKNITSEEWLVKILSLADFEQEKYGEHRDVSMKDVISWIFNDYFSYEKVEIKPVASTSAILKELERGNVVLIPTDGQALKNPYFSAPGPEEHMIVIKGYDYKTQEFITNDPGTRRGENYRYSPQTIFNAIRPYETGFRLPFPQILVRKMIVVSK